MSYLNQEPEPVTIEDLLEAYALTKGGRYSAKVHEQNLIDARAAVEAFKVQLHDAWNQSTGEKR